MVLKEITVRNKAYGKLDGVKIYLTKDLFDYLSEEKTSQNISLLNLLKNGRALRGEKHLIEIIKTQNKNNKIILTFTETRKEKNNYYINFKDYGKKSQAQFFSLYRETGLDTAKSYLNNYFPEDFKYDKNQLKQSEINKLEKKLPEVINSLSKKPKSKKILIRETSKILEKLKTEKRMLKKDVADLKELQERSNISFYKQKLEEFKSRLRKNYPETRGKNSWQTWIYENDWLFGIHYQKPIEKEKIGFNSIPDFLFPTLDGFLDILEIKRPSIEVIKEDSSHRGSYMWASETNKAIGQVINYIYQIELNQLQLMKRINEIYGEKYKSAIFTIKPRGFILVGVSNVWKDMEKEAFRKLNYSLHGIAVLTYTDLYNRGERIIQLYTDKIV